MKGSFLIYTCCLYLVGKICHSSSSAYVQGSVLLLHYRTLVFNQDATHNCVHSLDESMSFESE